MFFLGNQQHMPGFVDRFHIFNVLPHRSVVIELKTRSASQ